MKQNILLKDNRLKNQVLKNRAVVALTRVSATEDAYVTDTMVQYYRNFATGAFDLIITEGTYIEDKYSQTYLN